MATIAYDLPVRDFIADLDETGHVSHVQHRKDMVTIHHNGAPLSHDGLLSVWQVREASAHFNVDRPGTVAQFVRINEYAWATGSTSGNQRSISIEMCNETVGPEWKVGEATWRAAARLAGWIFARVIGARPTRDTLVVHKYWSATTCAGPYVDSVYDHILWFAQQSYDAFAAGRTPDGGDDVSKQDVIDGLREFYRDYGGEARSATISHPEPVMPEKYENGKRVMTSIELEARWNAANVAEILKRVDAIAAPEVDHDKLADALIAKGFRPATAAEIADELDRRARDNNPATGPVT